MTTTVLVPLDATDKDARALSVGAAIADAGGAAIELVRVIPAPARSLAAQAQLLGVDEDAVTGRRQAESELAELASRLSADAPRRVGWAVIESADVADALMRHASDLGVLAVVMATRAATPAGRAFIGSVADRVVRECRAPVVVVPPRADYLGGRRVGFSRVLVPLDGSALAAKALEFLLALPHAGTLEYVLLAVADPADRAEAEVRLAAAAGRARARGATIVETLVVEAHDPAAVILAALREELIDAIAMSTRGQSGLRRMVLGSVAEGVVRASEVPVLLLTPASLAEA